MPAASARWLDAANVEVMDLLAPYPSEAMTWHAVSTRVNAVRNDDPALIAPVAAEAAAEPSSDTPVPPKDPVQAQLL